MTIDEILERLGGGKKAGGSYMARCPAHEDRTASLSVGEGSDGRILMHCHAGCAVVDICARIGITVADLMAAKPSDNGKGKLDIIATYDYTDEGGTLLYQVCRLAPKSFRQRRPEGEGWTWRLGDTRRVPYHLPRLVEAVAAGETIYVVEGEKDVAAVEEAGGVATCNPGGAGKWRDEYSETLKGATVVCLPDNDDPGRDHMAHVARSLRARGAVCTVVALPGLLEKGDVSDWLTAGHSLAELEALVPEEQTDPGPYIDWAAFWDAEHNEAEWIYPDVLAKGRGHALYATHKEGKSLFMLHLAAELATGPEPVVVTYLDYEMTEADVHERLEEMGYGPQTDLSRLRYALQPALPALDNEDGGAALMALLDETQAMWPDHHQVCIIDTASRAVSGAENDADTFRAFYSHTGIAMKRRGITWARLDHAGKDLSRQQRGSSAKGDDVDVIWLLAKSDRGVVLTREASRMSWVPSRIVFTQTDDPLGFVRSTDDWPAGTGELANILDRLKVPTEATIKVAREALKTIEEKRRTELIGAAMRWRRSRDSQQETGAEVMAENRQQDEFEGVF